MARESRKSLGTTESQTRQRSARTSVVEPVPQLTPRLQLVRGALVVVFVLTAAMLVQLLIVSRLQASAAQGQAYDRFRAKLASGTAPIGPTDDQGRELPVGTSIAYLEIPSIGLRQVVAQGTTAGVLFDGPGHRRDTPLPGQAGSSVLFGRKAAFGGPFTDLDELQKGAAITVTTGQGIFHFTVLGVRAEGDPAPPAPAAGTARLQLVTAAGTSFFPSGVLRVDAELDDAAVGGSPAVVTYAGLTSEERAMSGDSRTLWVLALWLQALVALSLGVVWAWHRWGRAQTWVVFLPPLVVVGLAASGEAIRLLPNLL